MDIISTTHRDIDYKDSLRHQQEAFDQGVQQKKDGTPVQHRLFFNEHKPVITLGRHAKESNVLFSEEILAQNGVSLFHISRGGDATYHGPGQWTIYPVFDLEELGLGVRDFVEALEEVAIRILAKYGLSGHRLPGASGVWMHIDSPMPRKVAAIGIHCSRYITMHGMAFNANTDPKSFHWINPCGFTDKGVTSLHLEVGQSLDMETLRDQFEETFAEVFGRTVIKG
ncbi:lipoyl(octanoyl) transferase LipB [Porphyromonas sp.]|uniref:lipoyl(octanoyl) transferase LipB n=1 Tax=Porphyromonas sp. TaxID=1924944 RepID=UPI0026DCFDD4|nr:lipoyl(octanoyl) transferase LipB [Porphyromonas sp.]MDO4771184.1 lipoyl(octanoyl) transferase LipB [Porphyromonas sp.]